MIAHLNQRFIVTQQITENFFILNLPTTLAEINSQLLFNKPRFWPRDYETHFRFSASENL